MRARSIWFGISVGLVILAIKAWLASRHVAPLFDAEGMPRYKCGLGNLVAFFAFVIIAIAAGLSIIAMLAQKPPAPPPVPRMTAR